MIRSARTSPPHPHPHPHPTSLTRYNNRFDTCNEKEVREIADALVSEGLRDLGYTTILLDDCWSAETRNASTNELMPVAKTFPSGIPALVDYLGDRGIDLGLYTDVGKTTCRKGRPGSFGHYQLDAETLVGWGVKYVKIDNCDRPAGWTEQQLYGKQAHSLTHTHTHHHHTTDKHTHTHTQMGSKLLGCVQCNRNTGVPWGVRVGRFTSRDVGWRLRPRVPCGVRSPSVLGVSARGGGRRVLRAGGEGDA